MVTLKENDGFNFNHCFLQLHCKCPYRQGHCTKAIGFVSNGLDFHYGISHTQFRHIHGADHSVRYCSYMVDTRIVYKKDYERNRRDVVFELIISHCILNFFRICYYSYFKANDTKVVLIPSATYIVSGLMMPLLLHYF